MAIEKAQEEKVKTFCTEITRFGRYINRIKTDPAAIAEWIIDNVAPERALKSKEGTNGYEVFGNAEYSEKMPYAELIETAKARGYNFKTVEGQWTANKLRFRFNAKTYADAFVEKVKSVKPSGYTSVSDAYKWRHGYAVSIFGRFAEDEDKEIQLLCQ